MKFKLPKLPKIDSKEATKCFYRQMAPNMLAGFISGKVRGVSPIESYNFLMTHDLWEIVPEDRKPWLLGVRPWGLAEWMNIDWLFHTLKGSNPPLATMIVTSPKFKQRMKAQLSSLVTLLDKNNSQ